ncbi:FAD/NAD(P)-binding domain-containing protein [Hypomontagnella monticulosa]|nr:FAD/NAD(P)-binding domain-containing protein [Hypomontagnella monticulosa]
MPLKILVIGAGICGPAFATLLRQSNPDASVTVIERYPGIRHNGLQIDLRSWGVPIMKSMGLIDAVKQVRVKERGVAFVNSKGRDIAIFEPSGSGTGRQSFTSDFEIMRGDLAQILYEDSLRGQTEEQAKSEDVPGIRYRFDTTVAAFDQDDDGVDVTFSNGSKGRYDLVVGADGQWSKTRRMMFGDAEGLAMFKPLDVYVAYYTIPKEPGDDDGFARGYLAGGGRGLTTRTGDRPTTQAYLMFGSKEASVRSSIERQPVERQKETFLKLFKGSGWKEERLLQGLRTCTDFYADSIGQIKAPTAVKGRIALIGDAGFCASPITGMGTTLSLITAWTLAGELARNKNDVKAALAAYDANVRPYVKDMQSVPPGVPWLMTLHSKWSIAIFHVILRFLAWIQIDKLLFRILPENRGGMEVPNYPELGLKSSS